MLKQRVVSALLLVGLLLAILFVLPPFGFALAITAVILLAVWEWGNLAGLRRRLSKSAFLALVLAAFYGSSAYVQGGWPAEFSTLFPFSSARVSAQSLTIQSPLGHLLIAAFVWWLVAFSFVYSYPKRVNVWGQRSARLAMGICVLIPAWLGLQYMRALPNGDWLTLLLFGVVAAADTGAYFTGRALGKKPLAPAVSPAKSWEGAWGGFACSAALVLLVGSLFLPEQRWLLLAAALPTALVSVLGDLLESMIKRHRGIKDSGAILPGHGGILDRIDAITAAVPIFALALLLTQLPAQL